eukprot:scaffold73576_cov56-Attheya_sp.AAC.6
MHRPKIWKSRHAPGAPTFTVLYVTSGSDAPMILLTDTLGCLARIGLGAAIKIATGLGFNLGTSELGGLACPNNGLSQRSGGDW